jgi:hypothetical protein
LILRLRTECARLLSRNSIELTSTAKEAINTALGLAHHGVLALWAGFAEKAKDPWRRGKVARWTVDAPSAVAASELPRGAFDTGRAGNTLTEHARSAIQAYQGFTTITVLPWIAILTGALTRKCLELACRAFFASTFVQILQSSGKVHSGRNLRPLGATEA